MVNFKLTIINLHKEFPEMDLDKLIKITECIVEENVSISYPSYPNTLTYPWTDNIVLCSDNKIKGGTK